MNSDEAARLYQYFVAQVRQLYAADRVKDGRFQAMMEVALVNDGPVRQADILPCSPFPSLPPVTQAPPASAGDLVPDLQQMATGHA